MRHVEGQKRVIGTLLGTVKNGVVDVQNCFPVPHLEKDGEVAVGKDFNKSMLALQQRCYDGVEVVGWYATATDETFINEQSCLIQEFYESECTDPILLVVDTCLRNNTIGVKAFASVSLALGGTTLENTFQQLSLTTTAMDAEALAIDAMIKGQEGWKDGSESLAGLEGKMDALERSMGRLLDMLERCDKYVAGVVAGKTPPDNAIARQIANALAAVPRIRPEAFDKAFGNNLQDLLMVVYLSNLTRTQLAISDHLALQMARLSVKA